MRNRNVFIQFCLNEKEAAAFDKAVAKSGVSRSSYLRHLIRGLVPQDRPPPDFHSMMNELHAIGVNLNQIAQRAHAFRVIDSERYDENASIVKKAIVDIYNAVLLPRKP